MVVAAGLVIAAQVASFRAQRANRQRKQRRSPPAVIVAKVPIDVEIAEEQEKVAETK